MTEALEQQEKRILNWVGTCRHYTSRQCKQCLAGVDYESFPKRLPCVAVSRRGQAKCPLHDCRTQEEVEAEYEKRMRQADRGLQICLAMRARITQIADGERDVSGSMPCPFCGSGSVHWSIASDNGHYHMRCSTPGCVVCTE
jgi:hypothetical protein